MDNNEASPEQESQQPCRSTKCRISDAEWLVMEEIWKHHPTTASEIVGRLQAVTEWKDQTIRTMLARLTKKGFVQMLRTANAYFYKPLVERKEVVEEESQSFLNRVFGGSCQPLVLHLVENGDLTSSEIDELKKLLDNMEKQS